MDFILTARRSHQESLSKEIAWLEMDDKFAKKKKKGQRDSGAYERNLVTAGVTRQGEVLRKASLGR